MAFPWPDAEKPMMFYSQLGIEEISVSGTSFLNRTGMVSVSSICHVSSAVVSPALNPCAGKQDLHVTTSRHQAPAGCRPLRTLAVEDPRGRGP